MSRRWSVVCSYLLCLSLICIAARSSSSQELRRREDFYVDGNSIPGIHQYGVTIQATYAGLLPVSSKAAANKLFFFYVPYAGADLKASKDLIVWFNGGPGCSSLYGAYCENGPFVLQPSFDHPLGLPRKNAYAWSDLANVLYLEAPAGVGFSEGKLKIRNMDRVAAEVMGFLHTLTAIFPEIKNMTLYPVGESFGARSAAYLASALLDDHAQEWHVGGVGFVSGLLTANGWSDQIYTSQYVRQHQDRFQLNETYLNQIVSQAVKSGLDDRFYDGIWAFPRKDPVRSPAALQPLTFDIWYPLVLEKIRQDLCWNIYYIAQTCPVPRDPLAGHDPQEDFNGTDNFINLTPGFKEYIHATASKNWTACTVLPSVNDSSPPLTDSEQGILGKLIDRVTAHTKSNQLGSGRFVALTGGQDFRIIANGTMAGLQNTTWAGLQGFQQPPRPDEPSSAFVVAGQRQGWIHSERGVSFIHVELCGHECPKQAPEAAYEMARILLGRSDPTA